MGPLVPDIIGNELNFVVALFIGIGFGFILEQAGFSTSKKLVGLFYGYDFTVLRVFFTAGVTAMIGVITLDHFGMLDMDIVYVNPTFLWSAIVGGLIMGVGFVVGGFCPGTSFCAAAIGKKDGMAFVVGSFVGVFLFTEGFPLFAELYVAESWGYVRIFDTIGISQSLFAFMLTTVALFAFWATKALENRVNGISNKKPELKNIYVGLTGVVFILGVMTFFMPSRKTEMLQKLEDKSFVADYQLNNIDSDELALRFIKKDESLQLFDLRPKNQFDSLSLPNSIRIDFYDIFDKDFHKTLSLRNKINIFLANDDIQSKKAAILASELGYENVRILKGGINEFKTNIIEFTSPDNVENKRINQDTYRFRNEANKVIQQLITEYKIKRSDVITPKKSKRVIGGC